MNWHLQGMLLLIRMFRFTSNALGHSKESKSLWEGGLASQTESFEERGMQKLPSRGQTDSCEMQTWISAWNILEYEWIWISRLPPQVFPPNSWPLCDRCCIEIWYVLSPICANGDRFDCQWASISAEILFEPCNRVETVEVITPLLCVSGH